jgi:hypothetical protein
MGHEQQRAAMGREALLEPCDRVDVEVVRGLVEHQQDVLVPLARRSQVHQRPGQCHPLGLAPRQRRDRPVAQLRQADPVDDRGGLPARPHGVRHRGRRQRRVLIECDHAGAPAAPDGAGLRRLQAGELPQERRLSTSVQTDDGEPVTGPEGDRHIGEEWPARARGGEARGVEEDHTGRVRAADRRAASRVIRRADGLSRRAPGR